MKKLHIFSILGIALTFGACDYNDKNFDGLDEMVKPTHVVKGRYALTDADYAAISDNVTNREIAKELEVEKALDSVKTTLCLSEEIPGSVFLPAFLSGKYVTADEGSSIKVTYNYKEALSSLLAEHAPVNCFKLTEADYKLIYGDPARWTLNTRIVEKTEQYVLMEGKWNFDPSTEIVLEAVKGNEESAAFYQAIVDYVGTNYGTDYYQTNYTNTEFYYGASAYQNNFSFRLASWRTGHQAGESAYKNLTDEELTQLMYERLPEAIRVGLVARYGDADAVPGVQVTYTVHFSVYDGKDTAEYTIQFLVTGKAVFEYVEDSLEKILR